MLPNPFLTDAPQLQNSILPLGARNYSMVATPRLGSVENLNLNPWWVTGFVDGEGSFHVSVRKNKDSKLGWLVQQRFTIGLHVKDKAILQEILSYLVPPGLHKGGGRGGGRFGFGGGNWDWGGVGGTPHLHLQIAGGGPARPKTPNKGAPAALPYLGFVDPPLEAVIKHFNKYPLLTKKMGRL